MKRDDGGPLEVKPKLMVEPDQSSARSPDAANVPASSPSHDAASASDGPPGPTSLAPSTARSRATQRAQTARLVLVVASLGFGGLIFLIRFFNSSHGLGDAVLNADECRTGKMMRRSGGFHVGGICTDDCSDDRSCGDRFRCQEGHCVPRGTKVFGEACTAPWDCESYTCLATVPTLAQLAPDAGSALPASYCSRDCSEAKPCPTSFFCTDTGGKPACVKELAGAGDADLLELLRRAAADTQ